MSRAFVKETANDAPPPERMVADGPNLVTSEGLAHIHAEVARLELALKTETNVLLRETLERDLRYWTQRQSTAEVPPAAQGNTAAFGSRVTFTRAGRTQTYRIVGDDEADPVNGLINFRSPLARALIGAEPGDVVEMENPKGELAIVRVENA
jgi:transcription elongation GreA/GreB family factor